MMNFVGSPVHVTFLDCKSFSREECADVLHLCVLISDATAVAVFFLMEVVHLGGRWIHNLETPCSIPPPCH